MRNHFANILQILSRKLYLLIASIIIFVALRILLVAYAPNTLTNFDFSAGISGWTVAANGNGQAVPASAGEGPLSLQIPDSPEGSWVGVAQKLPAAANRQYRATVAYRLASGGYNSSTVLLRVSEFDKDGNLVNSEEVTNPTPLTPSQSGGSTTWNTVAHTFTSHPQANSLEIAVGLLGQQAATVEIDRLTLKAFPPQLVTSALNLLIALLAVLLIAAVGYKFFAGRAGSRPTIRWQAIAIIAINVVLLAVFAELAGLAIYFIQTGELFYTHKKEYPVIQEEQENQGEITRHRIHPYFGYVLRPHWKRELVLDEIDLTATTNNYGILSEYDYPFVKSNPNQYIIGLFGGSVAEEFYIVNRDRLVKNLQRNQFFADKEIVVLNFAKAGYKQPQQAIILTYFLSIGQEIDMAINLDGFNEVAGGARNNQQGIDVNMPHAGIMRLLVNLTDRTTLTPEKLQTFANIDRYKGQLNNLAQTLNNNNLAAVGFVLDQYYTYLFNQYQLEITKSEAMESDDTQASLLYVNPGGGAVEDSALYGQITDSWAESSVMMDRLMQIHGGIYFHFVQPNQYYSKKVLTEQELEHAFNEEHQYKPAAEKGYPFLVKKFDFLKQNIVHFYSAIDIFDDVAESTYRDDCCHSTQLGYDILADFMTDSILRAEAFQSSQAEN